jgi:hypothetical protein
MLGLNSIYWASTSGYPKGLDFITHSWFRLDGGPTPKTSLQGARINVLTTKVDCFHTCGAMGGELLNARRSFAQNIERRGLRIARGSDMALFGKAGVS